MKTSYIISGVFLFLVTAISVHAFPPLTVGSLPTQYTVLHSFNYDGLNHLDGKGPNSAPAANGFGQLFGRTPNGGNKLDDRGILYRINLDGSDYRILHRFDWFDSPGNHPAPTPLVLGNTLYGTIEQHSVPSDQYPYGDDLGAVYSSSASGSDTDSSPNLSYLHFFQFNYATNATDGVEPASELVAIGDVFYGTTASYGSPSPYVGTVFSIHADGSGYNILHYFGSVTNDGTGIVSGLTVGNDGTNVALYGNSSCGGTGGVFGGGVIFKINPDGSGYSILHNFDQPVNGGYPYGHLVYADGVLYGSYLTGDTSRGFIFRMNADGSGYTNITSYGYGNFVDLGDTLYGLGGLSGQEVWSLKTDGMDYATLHDFNADPLDGKNPIGFPYLLTNNTMIVRYCCPPTDTNYMCQCVELVTLTNAVIYGVTSGGGAYTNFGTVFALPLSVSAGTNSINSISVTSPAYGALFYTRPQTSCSRWTPPIWAASPSWTITPAPRIWARSPTTLTRLRRAICRRAPMS